MISIGYDRKTNNDPACMYIRDNRKKDVSNVGSLYRVPQIALTLHYSPLTF